MKRLLLLGGFLVFPALCHAQAVTVSTGYIASGTGQSSGLATPTTYYHQVSWSIISGTPATCIIKIDSSADNMSFSAGGVIDSQTCTNGGSSSVVNVQSNYIRINVSTFTGNATIKVTYTGYSSSGSGNGSVTPSATLTSTQVLLGGGTTVVTPAGAGLTYASSTLTNTGAYSGATYKTATNCAAVGTSANPSVAACGASAAGMFSCATDASTTTCQVNTTAVTANSEILIIQTAADGAAGQLNVTCNTALVTPSAKPILLSKSTGVSFTINLGTITTNPGCFEYLVIN